MNGCARPSLPLSEYRTSLSGYAISGNLQVNTRDSVSWEYPNTEKGVENTTRTRVFFKKFSIWIADETLPRMFDISSQLRLKLRGKQRNEIVKIFVALT